MTVLQTRAAGSAASRRVWTGPRDRRRAPAEPHFISPRPRVPDLARQHDVAGMIDRVLGGDWLQKPTTTPTLPGKQLRCPRPA